MYLPVLFFNMGGKASPAVAIVCCSLALTNADKATPDIKAC